MADTSPIILPITQITGGATTGVVTSLTTTGTGGASTLVSGVLNIPIYSGGGTGGTVTSVASGNGMNFTTITTTGSIVLGTPSSTTLASTNAVTSTSHTHAFAPGGTTAQYISGAGTLITFPTLTNGTVTSVAALTLGTTGTDLSSSVANSTTTPVITLNVPSASASNRGVLTSTDWSAFNSKQGALSGTGFVKISGTTISYDNSTYYLASNPSGYTTNLGTVTSVGLSSATSGVTIGSTPITTSGTITLAIATASGSQNGLLSSTDWTTFNNKQSTISLSAIGSTPNGNAATLSGSALNLEPASASFGGVVTTGTQTFAGAKTFSGNVTTNGEYRVDPASGDGILRMYTAGTERAVVRANSTKFFIEVGTFGERLSINNSSGLFSYTGAATFSSSVQSTGKLYIGNTTVYLDFNSGGLDIAANSATKLNISSTGAATFSSSVKSTDFRVEGAGFITFDANNAGSGTLVIRGGTTGAALSFAANNAATFSSTVSASSYYSNGKELITSDGSANYIKIPAALYFENASAATVATISNAGAATFSSTLSASNLSGTNTGDQTLAGLGGQPQLNGTGFVKASGTTISYDNSTYYLASNPSGYTSNTGTISSVGAIGSTPNANAATITGAVLNLEPASASFGGVVTTGTQTFAGAKTFNSSVTTSSYVRAANTDLAGTVYVLGTTFNGEYMNILSGGISAQTYTLFSPSGNNRVYVVMNQNTVTNTISAGSGNTITVGVTQVSSVTIASGARAMFWSDGGTRFYQIF